MLAISPDEVFRGFRGELLDLIRSFGELRDIPLALILNGRQEYFSDANRLSSFCRVLWEHPELRKRCLSDHEKRAAVDADKLEFAACHAGLFNLSLSLDCGPLGRGALLAGQRPGTRLSTSLGKMGETAFSEFLTSADSILSKDEVTAISTIRHDIESVESSGNAEGDVLFVRALGRVVEQYVKRRYAEQLEKIVFDRGLARVLHEVANASVYLDLNARGLLEFLPRINKGDPDALRVVRDSGRVIAALALESRFETLNLLESLRPDESDERAAWREHIELLDLAEVLRELWPAMEFLAGHEGKSLHFSSKPRSLFLEELTLPTIRGHRGMLLRALFNVFNNALKYSYRPSHRSEQSRFISVIATPQYSRDRPLFALSISSFGIAFASPKELEEATNYGVRGLLATEERPIGSGIGLAEVKRIMSLHKGYIKIQSNPIGRSPAHTVVWLVFRVPTGL